jgi:hypothetical protein
MEGLSLVAEKICHNKNCNVDEKINLFEMKSIIKENILLLNNKYNLVF